MAKIRLDPWMEICATFQRVSTGLVVSLARPSGNAAALSLQQTDLADKRLEPLREVVPALRRLAILANAGNPVTLRDMREVEAAAGPLGLTVVTLEIRRVEDITAGFEALRARANMFPPDPLLSTCLICWGGRLRSVDSGVAPHYRSPTLAIEPAGQDL